MSGQEKSPKALGDNSGNASLQGKQGEDTKKLIRKKRNYPKDRNTTLSQYTSWEAVKSSDTKASQENYILAILQGSETPQTRRQLEEASGIRVTNMTRIMNDLVKGGYVRVLDELIICQYTKRPVQQYQTLKDGETGISIETGTVIVPSVDLERREVYNAS
ncbi:hypothetical protein GCM10011344_32760 [Dokdonia pacifica]|uniref:Uncharacterized protein n=1 Tax=Dokdonia pacifica TaxID=1627892 RepID=A0A239BKB0_9FLAO|nr:MarR family transcriptional regulator [Dokdonia pacifica]GGG29351.1 hypothetical protein GCM10011344_32760 [Dokdonia pacifica]SNS07464.1 hypothetical protein SAMN06265376_106187 [Dokdonia pacifica]